MTEFEKKIGYEFKDKNLITRALTHSSYANERRLGNNERLEFLGDSVLGLITAEYLFTSFKDRHEGSLTKLRASLVCEQSLFDISKKIELSKHILLGHGEEMSGGRERPSVVSDAFEAVLAAIYLDGGFESAKEHVLRFILPELEHTDDDVFKDYKTCLQEVVQRNPEERLSYILIGESGPDHNKTFTVEVHLNSNVIGTGEGSSKKQAEQKAAKQALSLMGIEA